MRAEADFLTRCLLQEQQGAFNDDFSALTCKMIHQLPEIFLKMCLLDEGCISISRKKAAQFLPPVVICDLWWVQEQSRGMWGAAQPCAYITPAL